MSGKQETPTNDALRNVQHLIDPWTKAMQSWVTESEKLQQISMDNWTKALDNSHKIAREGLDMAAGVSATMQKQVSTQVERTLDIMGNYTR